MSNQYAQLYRQQSPQLHPNTTSQYQPQNGSSQPLRSSHVYPQPTYQLQHTQSPVSPIPLHYHAHSHPDHFSSQAASNHQPISAPSPQYPQQLPDVPHVGYSSPPTSPSSSGPSRRPLPTPGAPPLQFTSPLFNHPLPTPGPTPAPASPQSHSRPLRAGSLPSSSTILSSHQAASSFPSASPTSPTGGRRPLPLPRVAPGGSSDTAARSSSPAKDVLKLTSTSGVSPFLPQDHPSSSSQSRFVPYWKRTLPDPSSERAPSASSSQEAVSPCIPESPGSAAYPDDDYQLRDRSKSFTGGRPLPPSPLDGSVGKPPLIPPTISVLGESSRALPNPSSFSAQASMGPPTPIRPVKSSSSLPSAAGSSALFSNRSFSPTKPPCPISPATSDDDGKPSQNGKAPQKERRSPSPQYGILDLPPKSRSVISRNSTRHSRAPASIDQDRADALPRGRSIRSPTLPQAPIQNPSAQHSHRSTRSAIVQLAPVLPSAAGSSRHADSTPTSPTGWPPLPRPPRAPVPGAGKQPVVSRTRSSRQEYVNLDDAPPPSLRRSPSPSAVSTRAVPRTKTRSMASAPQRRFTQDAPVTPRRSAASVPSSPEKAFVSLPLPQVASGTTHIVNRSRSVTPASIAPERPRVQLPPAPRPPPSAFSQRFVSGKPAPAEPQVTTTRVTKPQTGGISGIADDNGANPSIFVSEPELPQITFSDPTASSLEDDNEPSPIDDRRSDHGPMPAAGGGRVFPPASSARRGGGLACGGCGGPIVGRIVSAMGVRWHPGCFRCSDCNDLLEYVSSYERDGKPFCHFDYHEVCDFLPRSRISLAHA
jgi:hypothetical protein